MVKAQFRKALFGDQDRAWQHRHGSTYRPMGKVSFELVVDGEGQPRHQRVSVCTCGAEWREDVLSGPDAPGGERGPADGEPGVGRSPEHTD